MIFTQEDAQFWFAVRHWSAIASLVLKPVAAPYCHPRDASINLAAIEQLEQRFADLNFL